MLDKMIIQKVMFIPGLLHMGSGNVVVPCQRRDGEMKKGMMELLAQEES